MAATVRRTPGLAAKLATGGGKHKHRGTKRRRTRADKLRAALRDEGR